MKSTHITIAVFSLFAITPSQAAETFNFLGSEAKSYEFSGTSIVDSWGTEQANNANDGAQLIRFHTNSNGSISKTAYPKSLIPNLTQKSGGTNHRSKGLYGYIEQVWPLKNGIVLFATDTYSEATGNTGSSYLYKLNTATGTVGNNSPSFNNKRAVLNMGERNNIRQTNIRALHHRSLLESSLTTKAGTRILFYAEYNISDQPQVGLWKSTNSGTSWTKVIEWNTAGHQTRHIHGIIQNPYNKWLYILFGDDNSESGIVAWNGISAAPPNNTPLAKIGANKANGRPLYPGWRSISGTQTTRAGDLVFTPPPPAGNGKCVWIPDVDSVEPGEKLFGQRANYDLTGLEATGKVPYTNGFPPILGARSNTGNIYWVSFRIDAPGVENKLHVWKSVDSGLTWMLAGKADMYTSWTIMPQNLRASGTKTATETTDTVTINGRDVEFVANGQKTGSTARFSSKTTRPLITQK